MKRNLLFMAVAAIAITSSAKVPEIIASQTNDTDAMAIYNAMDEFEQNFPDGFSSVNYDGYPDGIKVIARRIDFPIHNEKDVTPIMNVFDSITTSPNARRIVVKDINSNRSLRVYKMKDGDNINIDLSNVNGPNFSTSMAIDYVKNNSITIVQNWTLRNSRTYGAANFSALDNYIEKLRTFPSTITEKLQLTEQTDCGGALRLRVSEPKSENKLDCTRLVAFDSPVSNWIELHHVFMSYLGADANISLTYTRGSRTVTLVDLSQKKIYAARYRSVSDSQKGILTVLVANYDCDTPFLPDNWAVIR